ncbi:hypothetical protein F3Y22_tig00013040pilonHSYRG00071 [Hibiscus syriacus]|uniref:Uncharacterized protein n=1 Tax=Hibiscus syriacus TaxID=106335 RepID=A0A6A3C470_HIBSY|nr:hypothetical protein F3Y22_tig00013040pilonHSYRG00071 [Hibiscus syriacus]
MGAPPSYVGIPTTTHPLTVGIHRPTTGAVIAEDPKVVIVENRRRRRQISYPRVRVSETLGGRVGSGPPPGRVWIRMKEIELKPSKDYEEELKPEKEAELKPSKEMFYEETLKPTKEAGLKPMKDVIGKDLNLIKETDLKPKNDSFNSKELKPVQDVESKPMKYSRYRGTEDSEGKRSSMH